MSTRLAEEVRLLIRLSGEEAWAPVDAASNNMVKFALALLDTPPDSQGTETKNCKKNKKSIKYN
jgi:hypothetical protein